MFGMLYFCKNLFLIQQVVNVHVKVPYIGTTSRKPSPLEGCSYTIIEKSELCLCSLTAGFLFLQDKGYMKNKECSPTYDIYS